MRDKTRCGLVAFSPAPFAHPLTTSPPTLRERGRRGGGRRAARLPPPAFVAIRIPMLLFLTGHWWLYRQVLRRGCNYSGLAWWLPSLLPFPAVPTLLAPPLALRPFASAAPKPPPGMRARLDVFEPTSKFPPLTPRGSSPRRVLDSLIPLTQWFSPLLLLTPA